jgi:hypothetical protein
MRNSVKAMVFSVLVLVVALSVNLLGCSKFSRPSDEVVIKAINDAGILKSQSFTITSPLVILERGDQNKDGSWTFRVKMTMTMTLPNGNISEPKENEAFFRIVKAKDGSGKSVWKARLGS